MPIWYVFLNSLLLFALLFLAGLSVQYGLKGLLKIAGFISSPKLVNILVNIATFPGVVHHELSHAVMACASGARVTKIKFIEFGTGRLGHVNYRTRGGPVKASVQHCLTAMGPMLMGPVTITALWLFYYQTPLAGIPWVRATLAYITVSIIIHMRLSKSDMRNIWHGLPLCVIAAMIPIWLFDLDLIGFIYNFIASYGT